MALFLAVLPEGEHAPAQRHPLRGEAVRMPLLPEAFLPQRPGRNSIEFQNILHPLPDARAFNDAHQNGR